MQNVLIATFSNRQGNKRTAINGMIEPLLSYFLPKVKEVDLIDGSHPGCDTIATTIEEYKNNALYKTHSSFFAKILYPLLAACNTNGTRIIFKIRDFLSAIEWGIRSGKSYELFIGLESIFTLAGILLRNFGKAKTVVYYVSDYSPVRYKNALFNRVYLLLDRFCAQHADYIWDVSEAMQNGRIQAGLNPKKSAPVIIVNNALFSSQIIPLSENELIPNSIVFAGTLGLENGPDIAIKATHILKKDYPNIQLHIFGGNEEGKETYLKNLTQSFNVEKNVFFHGFIDNARELSRQINKFMIGLAPYKKQQNSVRAFGDATKLRLYMGAGLPAITTTTPPLGRVLSQNGSAIITDANEKSFSKEIKKLFDSKTFLKMRKQAIAFGENNTWENTYSKALSRMSHLAK